MVSGTMMVQLINVMEVTTMENETYDSLVSKLHPNRITGASDQVYYIMSSILNQEWVTHDRGMGMFTETSDHFVVDCGLFLGHIDDGILCSILIKSWR